MWFVYDDWFQIKLDVLTVAAIVLVDCASCLSDVDRRSTWAGQHELAVFEERVLLEEIDEEGGNLKSMIMRCAR